MRGALRRSGIGALGLLGAGVPLLFYHSMRDAAEIRRLNDKIEWLREINQSLHGRIDDFLHEDDERAERDALSKIPVAVGRALPMLYALGWVNGALPSPADLAGKVVVLDLWADW